MADVRFNLDAHQLRIILTVIDRFLLERPQGEVQNLIHSIAEILAVRFGRRLAERRLESKFILPVYQAIAYRRMVLAGLDLYDEGAVKSELRIMAADIDKKMTLYTRVR